MIATEIRLIAISVRSSVWASENPPTKIAVPLALIDTKSIGITSGKLSMAIKVADWEALEAIPEIMVNEVDSASEARTRVVMNNI